MARFVHEKEVIAEATNAPFAMTNLISTILIDTFREGTGCEFDSSLTLLPARARVARNAPCLRGYFRTLTSGDEFRARFTDCSARHIAPACSRAIVGAQSWQSLRCSPADGWCCMDLSIVGSSNECRGICASRFFRSLRFCLERSFSRFASAVLCEVRPRPRSPWPDPGSAANCAGVRQPGVGRECDAHARRAGMRALHCS